MHKEISSSELIGRSPNILAYVGDAVLELYVREQLVKNGVAQLSQLHRITTEAVSAKGQAKAYERLLETLNEDEIAAMKRGRNTDSGAVPKNATVAQYRAATGVECLIGWLYLKGNTDRLNEVLRICFKYNI